MIVRPALDKDCRAIYDIAMQPSVRENSTRSDFFTYEEHQAWWRRRFHDGSATTKIWVAEEVDGLVAGYIRYGKSNGVAEIAIATTSSHRKRGIARLMLQQTLTQAATALDVAYLIALVWIGNLISERLFESAGFVRVGWEERMGKQHARFQMRVS